jgi:hypothetical protein
MYDPTRRRRVKLIAIALPLGVTLAAQEKRTAVEVECLVVGDLKIAVVIDRSVPATPRPATNFRREQIGLDSQTGQLRADAPADSSALAENLQLVLEQRYVHLIAVALGNCEEFPSWSDFPGGDYAYVITVTVPRLRVSPGEQQAEQRKIPMVSLDGGFFRERQGEGDLGKPAEPKTIDVIRQTLTAIGEVVVRFPKAPERARATPRRALSGGKQLRLSVKLECVVEASQPRNYRDMGTPGDPAV